MPNGLVNIYGISDVKTIYNTEREINFINDIGKEIVKDVSGSKIYYFPISVKKSRVHDVYEESPHKGF